MSNSPFVHLHVHSHFSLGGGVATIESLMRRAAENDMPAMALTDRLSLSGVVPAMEAGERYGVKPILGCEIPLRLLGSSEGVASPDSPGALGEITFLAETDQGLRYLSLLLNRALSRTKSPHITLTELAEQSEGLIALVGGPRSSLARMVSRSETDMIDRHLSALTRAMGRDHVVFEVAQHEAPFPNETNTRLMAIAEFLGMPAVATADVWYLDPVHALAHDFEREVPCEITRWARAMRRHPPTEHFASPGEMTDHYAHHMSLLEGTLTLAERCNAGVDLRRQRYPKQDFTRGLDANSFLWDLVFRSASNVLGTLTDEHKARLNAELNHVAEEGTGTYLIVLWQLAQELDKRGVLRGVGEGRLQTSLMAHVLGLTEINPLLHGFGFQGFRESGEAGLCLGLEISADSISLAEMLLNDIVGVGKVARVGRAPRTGSRPLRRSLCEWAGLTKSATEKVLNQWPRRTVSEAEARRAWEETLEATGDLTGMTQLPREVIHLTGQALTAHRNPHRVHGGEIIVSGEELASIVPLVPVEGSSLPMAEIDSDVIDQLGLLRLEVRTPPAMAIIENATQWVRSEERADFHPSQINFDDHETWVLVGRGETSGLPGLDRISMKSALRAAHPRSLQELMEIMGGDRESNHRPPLSEATLAMRCAHLKAHYPVSYMAAMLSACYSSKKQLRILLREATGMGIRLLAPDINMSHFKFSQEGNSVRAGLMCVRGMTQAAYDSINRARQGGAFQDLQDLWERTDHPPVTSPLVANLIKGGVLDTLEPDRALLLQQASHLAKMEKQRAAGAQALDLFEASSVESESAPALDEATLVRHEENALGALLTSDPLEEHSEVIKRLRAVAPRAIQSTASGEEISVVGFIDHEEQCEIFGEETPVPILDLEGQVVVIAPEMRAAVEDCITQGEPVLVMGEVQHHDHERYLRAHQIMSLERAARIAEGVTGLRLDLMREDKRTVKMLIALFKQHPGETKIEVSGQPAAVSKRLTAKITQKGVHCSPTLLNQLRRILPPDAVETIRGH